MLGNNISELRKKRGYTISELAKRSHISKSYLSNIERNINKNPSIDVIKKIAVVLDVDLETLIGAINEEQIDLDNEWLNFIKELKEAGLEREEIHRYKNLFEFIKWQNQNSEKNK